MDSSSDDACITVRLVYRGSGWRDGLASVFINREGRDPTLAELQLEHDKARAAERREFDMTEQRLLWETGTAPNEFEIRDALHLQLEDPKFNSEETVYHRWDQNPSYPANSKLPTSRSNPIDLTKSDQSATKTSTKNPKTDLRQTNAVAVKSPAPLYSFNILSQTKPESVPKRTLPELAELSSQDRPQTNPTQMSETGRPKVKAVTKTSALLTSSAEDLESRSTAKAAAKIATESMAKASSQPLRKKHTADTRRIVQSKSSPPPASTSTKSSQTFSARETPRCASDKPQISFRPWFRKQLKATQSSDEDEQLGGIPESTQALPLSTSIVNDKPLFKVSQPQSDPASSQKPAPALIGEQALVCDVPTTSASLCKSS